MAIDGVPTGTLDGDYTVTAVAWDPRQQITDYQWRAQPQNSGTLQMGTGSSFTFHADSGDVYNIMLVALDDGALIGSTSTMAGGGGGPLVFDMPTLSVSEIDPGQTVQEGGQATFDIHLDTGANGVAGPVTVYCNTVDGSGRAATDYQASNGPQKVTFLPGVTDAIVHVQTVGGFHDGADKTFSLTISHQHDPNADPSWEDATTASATVTIVRPVA